MDINEADLVRLATIIKNHNSDQKTSDNDLLFAMPRLDMLVSFCMRAGERYLFMGRDLAWLQSEFRGYAVARNLKV